MKQDIKEPSAEHSYTYKYPHPAVTADCVIFGFDGTELKVLLVERGFEPYKGMWALPGGFMNIDETAEQCARRELKEETGLNVMHLEQFQVFTDVNRDPRERVISIAFWAFVQIIAEVNGCDDVVQAQWFSLDKLPPLAFDHKQILQTGITAMQQNHPELLIDEDSHTDFECDLQHCADIKI